MFKIIFLSLLVLHLCNLVYSGRRCNDCKYISSCKAADDHARFKQDDETKHLFEKALCGTEMVDGEPVYKVCCSDFPRLNNVIENRWGSMNKENQLPDKCGSILGNRIIGGKKAKLYEFPWMVLISYNTREGPQFQCGGTIINSKYVLTAAHCVVDKKIMGVRIGEFDINEEKDCEYEPDKVTCEDHIQDMFVAEKIPHANYQKTPVMNDIALLRVEGEIFFNYSNVEPVCLPLSSSLRTKNIGNKIGTVAGWGYTENGKESPVLLKVEVPVKTEDDCKGFYNRNNRNAVKNQFCAGELKKDSCQGDSGGPLLMKDNYNGVNSYIQYGIVSHGPLQCGSMFPGVYTDIRKYVDWILDNIKVDIE